MSFEAALYADRPLILDGGLATELARRGHDIGDALWSARVLIDSPQSIEALHYDYFAAGAQCVTTASYQASYRGFAAAGLGQHHATALLERSVALALSARERFARQRLAPGPTLPRLFVAASIGPYGATLHDGSEYRGDYALSEAELAEFHAPRLAVLADAGADIMACETIPILREARAIARALADLPSTSAWVSFTSMDGIHTAGGDTLVACAQALDPIEQVKAIGVNCVSPDVVSSCLHEVRRGTAKPLVAYPNTAGSWDASTGRWSAPHSFDAVIDAVPEWIALGARVVGGCCGTTPRDIASLTRRIATT